MKTVEPGHSRGWDTRTALSLATLYGTCFSAILCLILAANSQGVLTKEEASSGFVNPLFLEWRLQHHVMGTNFYAYVLFLLGSRAIHGLFYGRFVKAAIMALLPCFVFLYVRKKHQFQVSHALAGALAVGLLPGYLCLAWLGVDFGMETVIGFGALCLTLYDAPAAVVGSGVVAALSAESYGSGLAFVAAVAAANVPRLRVKEQRRIAVASFLAMAAVLVLPAFWWKNIQTLFIGGSGGPAIHGSIARLRSLPYELFVHGNSYYFFSNGIPAAGSILASILVVAGLCRAVFRTALKKDFSAVPLLVISSSSIVIYLVAGNVSGVRRVLPLVISLGICGVLMLHSLAEQRIALVRTAAAVIFGAWIIFECHDLYSLRQGLASAQVTLPRDFEFGATSTETMATRTGELLNDPRAVPEALEGFEPDRTLCILYVLGKRSPGYYPRSIISRCDQHGWSIPSTAAPFGRVRLR